MKIICVGILLTVCDVPDPPKPTAVVCPPLVEWKAADQQAAAQALSSLPSGHPLRKMATVVVRQRDVVRACKQ